MVTNIAPLTIGLIDDDDIYQFTAKKIIERINPAQKILTFSNGKEAIEYLTHNFSSKELPDVIFLDINMPVMNGWEFLEAYDRVKGELQKPITIYMVSSSIDEQDRLKSKSFKTVKDYISKPLDKHMLINILKGGHGIA